MPNTKGTSVFPYTYSITRTTVKNKLNLLETFPFLKSTRFWAVVTIAASMWLVDLGWMPETPANFIYTIAGGHIGLRTIDKVSENIGKK